MKRKYSLLLFVLIFVLGFTGCSNKTTVSSEDEQMMVAYANAIVQWLPSNADEDVEFYRGLSEFNLNVVLSANLQIPTTPEHFVGMLDSWEMAEEECGKLVAQPAYDFAVKENSDGYIVSAPAKFEKRDATISVCFDKDHNITLVEVSAKYSLGEIMTKAGINTVLGMGVVFAVLIVLAFIISQMKLIPMLFGKKVQKEEPKVVETKSVEVVPASTPTDDLELIAVITAAIAAQEGKSADGFVVRSIRRRPSNHWK